MNKANKEQQGFWDRYNERQNRISEKYGLYLYYLIQSIFNVNHLEELVEEQGYEVKRIKDYWPHALYSEILFDGKMIGTLHGDVIPNITIDRRQRTRHARPLVNAIDELTTPTKGIHRILEWHEVEGKMHKLAGGETVLYIDPVEISNEEIDDFLTKTGLIDKVEQFKEEDKKALQDLKETLKKQ